MSSTFGKKFSQYWEGREDAESSNRIKTMQGKTRQQIIKGTTNLMSCTSSEVAGTSPITTRTTKTKKRTIQISSVST